MFLYPKLYLNSVKEITLQILEKNNIKGIILDVDNTLIDERKKQIIHQRYGIDDGSPKTYEEIGEVYNISSERVRQLTTICLRTLRNPENKIQKYF